MPIEHRCIGGTDIAILTGDEKQIIDVQSALDLAISLKHEAGIDRIAIDKHVVADEFFILSSGMAGEINHPEVCQLPCHCRNIRGFFPVYQQTAA